MVRLLTKDEQIFRETFPEASSYLLSAELRNECFSLHCRKFKNDWEVKRYQELLKCPACKEPWFQRLIKERD